MEILIAVVSFIIIFSILILVHEWGHFITAKKSGVKVEEFGMGLPPRALTLYKDKDGTIYSLNWIPFGGFVRMLGEDDHEESTKKDPRSFINQPLWKRMLIVTAGVIMNFLLATVLLSVVFTAGFYPLAIVDDQRVPINSYIIQRESFAKNNGTLILDENSKGGKVAQVEKDSLAAKAGFQEQDVIVAINGKKVDNALTVLSLTKENAGKSTIFTIERDSKEIPLTLTPEKDHPIGIYLEPEFKLQMVQFSFPSSVLKAGEEVARQSYITLILAKNMVVDFFQKFKAPEGVSGPVGIARMTGDFVKLGFIPILIFLSLLSVSLGVMNILPFPALDGGRFLFMLIELVTRKKASARLEATAHGIGFAILMLLIILITWNDIAKLIQG